jgi:two-component system, NarL family, sensor kinase
MYEKFSEESFLNLIVTITIVFLFLVSLLIVFFVIYNNRKNKILKEKLMLQSKFEQELLQTQIEIQEQTLANVSQELHDNIGQSLTLAKLNLNTLPTINDEKANTQINNSKILLSNTLTNIRDLAKSMLGEKIAEIGIEAAVRNELSLLEHTGKYKITIETLGDDYMLHPQKEIVAFRIIQEAIHNIIKHAEASIIKVHFNYLPETLTVTIIDNGKGYNQDLLQAKNTGVGLKNMQNRALLINANLIIQSAISQGTSLTLIINR